ncbi:MAG: hypothetical protein Q9191_001572 [Dirinaria sp. TL-2023a]
MALRAARFQDLDVIASMFAEAFWDEIVLGKLFHPYRAAFPQDYRRYWRQKVSEWYWDVHHHLIVYCILNSNERGHEEETLTGVADWMRLGEEAAQVRRSCISRVLPCYIGPNRAADPAMSNASIVISSLISHHWSGQRSVGWYLNFLAVLPAYQCRGYGSNLVSWGVERAQQEGVAASVISGQRKDDFYKRCGFNIVVGNSTEGEGNPLKDITDGGTIFFREPAAR